MQNQANIFLNTVQKICSLIAAYRRKMTATLILVRQPFLIYLPQIGTIKFQLSKADNNLSVVQSTAPVHTVPPR